MIKKICSLVLVFSLIVTCNVYGANLFQKGTGENVPLGTESPSDLDDLIHQNIADPVDRLLGNYQRNASLAYASSSTLTINIGEVVCANTADTIRRMRANTSATTLTWANIDTGAEANNTYYIYAVADTDAKTFTGVISLSASTPTSVTYYKRLGSFANVAGDITRTSITNDDNYYALSYGDWASKSIDTSYEATTDGLVTSTAAYEIYGYTDSSNPPTTERVYAYDDQAFGSVCFPVKKGDYWKVTGGTVFWLPTE